MTTTAEALLPPSPRPFRGIPRNHSVQNHPNRSHNAPTTAPKPPRTAPTPPPTNRGIATKPPTPLPSATPTCDSIHTYVRTDGLTKNLQDRTHLLALRNAHEKNAQFDSTPRSNP